jgi:hypothetical protein
MRLQWKILIAGGVIDFHSEVSYCEPSFDYDGSPVSPGSATYPSATKIAAP